MKSKQINFSNEKDGQIKFFEDLRISADVSLTNNTDGVYKGTIFEFKLTIPDINRVLFQAIKYLSHMRVKGESLPKTILLIALNEEKAYKFESKDFLKEIEKIYFGASSKDNKDFSTDTKPEKINYGEISGLNKLTEILQKEGFIKVHIDIYDVVGWANRFYLENPKATKTALFNELKNPKHFKELIYPWKGKESDFKYILDLLNDRMHRKELGAFYTPPVYCKKSLELIRQAVKQIPKGNNYILVDRCAGTGNLEEFLTDKDVKDITIDEVGKYINEKLRDKYLKDKKDIISTYYSNKTFGNITIGELEKYKTNISLYDYIFDNELSHCIVATYELKEWVVLNERIGDKVNTIIPPPPIDPNNPLVNGGDALAIDVFEEIKPYIKDKKCNIIMFENPPYRDTSGSNIENEKNKTTKGNFVFEEMKKDLVNLQNSNISTARDISNQFIWSAWEYYLKKENDCYVLFSPIKYWKSLGLGDRKFIDGFLFNREHFHAGASAISCICWQNIREEKNKLNLKAFDIDTKNNAEYEDDSLFDLNKEIEIHKAKTTLTPYYEKRKFDEDKLNGIYSEGNGYEANRKTSTTALFNENILGYMFAGGFSVDAKHITLVRTTIFNGRGFYLRKDNFIEKLPLFCAKLYPQRNWYERDIYFTTADGKGSYIKDSNFLKSCLIFTCLSPRNRCIAFEGSDKRFYQNELCLDGETFASKTLKNYKLNKNEQELIHLFGEILKEAKNTKNYNSRYKYGTYQIDKELNTFRKDENENKIYDYPELNTKINTLKQRLQDYYESVIQPKLFQYQLLK
jgi:hypothetical protein